MSYNFSVIEGEWLVNLNVAFLDFRELCGEKSLWQSFKNQKSESTVLLDFPLAFSWCTPFFQGMLFSWWNLQNKMATFRLFGKNWKKPILNVNFLNQNCIKLNFYWAHLNACSARIILDPRTFNRGHIWGLFWTFWKVSIIKKICCNSSSMPKKCPHFSSTGNQKTVE